jgi:hypothetical protein
MSVTHPLHVVLVPGADGRVFTEDRAHAQVGGGYIRSCREAEGRGKWAEPALSAVIENGRIRLCKMGASADAYLTPAA